MEKMTAIVEFTKGVMWFCLGIAIILIDFIKGILPVLIFALAIKILFFM